MLASFDFKFISSVGMARLSVPVGRVVGRPEKLDIKGHLHAFLFIIIFI